MAKYIERVVVASRVVNDKTGEMMWETLYIEFAMTTRGGRHSEDDAISHEKACEVFALNTDTLILFDCKGPLGKLPTTPRAALPARGVATFAGSEDRPTKCFISAL